MTARDVVIDEDASVAIGVDAVVQGTDAPVAISITQKPAHGALTEDTGAYTYEPAENFHGADEVAFTASAGDARSETVTVRITVRPVNDLPTAAAASAHCDEDAVASGAVAGEDVDGDALTYSVVSGPAHGAVSLNPSTGAFTYTPNADFHGADSFTYKANDGTADSNTATVTLTVNPVNDVPVAVAGSASGDEETVLTGTLAASDVDGDALTYSLVTAPTNGAFSFNASTGAFTFTPDANFSGLAMLSFRVNDGAADSNVADFVLTVNPVNDAPAAANGSASGDEDTALTGTVSATDVDGDALTYGVVAQPARGAVVLNAATGAFTYTPNANYNGADTFTFKANDGALDSNTATVTLTVNAVNDVPVSVSGSASGDEETVITGTLAASDVDGDALTYSLVTAPTNGAFSFNASTGAFTFTPDVNFSGFAMLSFRVNDGAADSNVADFVLSVNPVNDAPVAANGSASGDEDTALTGTVSATDVDGDALTYGVVAQPARGAVVLNAATGAFTYTPNANYNGADTFTFKANDGTVDSNTATVSLTVNAVNDAPVAAAGAASGDEDTVLTGTVAATDAEGGALTYSVVTQPASGTLSLNASTGAFSYTPVADAYGAFSFTFKASDGALDSNTATVSLTVTPVNDAPVAAGGSASGDEDTVLIGTVTAGDIEGDAITYNVVTQPTHGAVALDPATGAFSYTPAANYFGGDSFTFAAADATDASLPATVTLTVNPVADAPVAQDAIVVGFEDSTLNASAAGIHPDGSIPLTYTLVTGTTIAPLTFNADGTFSYTPPPDFYGTDTFTYTVNDGAATSALGTMTLDIQNVNDAPYTVGADYAADFAGGNALTLGAQPQYDFVNTFTFEAWIRPDDNTGERIIINNEGRYEIGLRPDLQFAISRSDLAWAWISTGLNPPLGQWTHFALVYDYGAVRVYLDGVESFTTVLGGVGPLGDDLTAMNETRLGERQYVSTPFDGGMDEVRLWNVARSAADVYYAYGGVVPPDSPGLVGAWRFETISAGSTPDDTAYGVTASPLGSGPVQIGTGLRTLREDTPRVVSVAGDDIDSAALSATVATYPQHGRLYVWNGAQGAELVPGGGAVTGPVLQALYVPDADYAGADSFTYVVSDGAAVSPPRLVTLVVSPVPDLPRAYATWVTGDEDTLIGGTALAASPDGHALTYTLEGGPAFGTLQSFDVFTGAFTYAPSLSFFGSDSFTFSVADIVGGSGVATVTITVANVNDAPEATTLAFTVPKKAPYDDFVAGTDVDGDLLTYGVVTAPTHGSLLLTPSGAFTYTPDAGYSGPDSFWFYSYDGALASAPGEVQINVSPNAAPVAADTSVTTREGKMISETLSAADVNLDALTYALVGGASHGTVSVAPGTGVFVYTPVAGYVGGDAFTFKANDGALDSNTATVTVTIEPTNQPPVVVPGQILVAAPPPANFLALGMTDAEGDTASVALISGLDYGSAAGGVGGLDYTAAQEHAPGVDVVGVRASDGWDLGAETPVRVWLPGCLQDADGDGYGADCPAADFDEGNPLRNPGALDLYAGDRDQNGDGVALDLAAALYVDGTLGDDLNLGTAYAPLKTLSAAIAASVAGQPILVAGGTYPENGLQPRGPVIGGFSEGWAYLPGQYPTVVGDLTGTVFSVAAGEAVLLQGLTVWGRAPAVWHAGDLTLYESNVLASDPGAGGSAVGVESAAGRFTLARSTLDAQAGQSALGYTGASPEAVLVYASEITVSAPEAVAVAAPAGTGQPRPPVAVRGNRITAVGSNLAVAVAAASPNVAVVNNLVAVYGSQTATGLSLAGAGQQRAVLNTVRLFGAPVTAAGIAVHGAGVNVVAGNIVVSPGAAIAATQPLIARSNLLQAPDLLKASAGLYQTAAALNACVYPACDEAAGNLTGDPQLDARGIPAEGSPAVDAGADSATWGYYGLAVTDAYNPGPRPRRGGWDLGAYELGTPVTAIAVTFSYGATVAAPGDTVQALAQLWPTGADASLTWSVDDPAVAIVSPTGLVTAKAKGSVWVTARARDGTGIVGAARLTVDTRVGLFVSPSTAVVIYPSSLQLRAFGAYGGGVTAPIATAVSWSTSAPAIIAVDADGLAAAVTNTGTVTVSAALGSLTGQATLTAIYVTSLVVTPENFSATSGRQQPMTAVATYSNGTQADVTTLVDWSAVTLGSGILAATGEADPAPVVTITASGLATMGEASGVFSGWRTAQIVASYLGATDNADVTYLAKVQPWVKWWSFNQLSWDMSSLNMSGNSLQTAYWEGNSYILKVSIIQMPDPLRWPENYGNWCITQCPDVFENGWYPGIDPDACPNFFQYDCWLNTPTGDYQASFEWYWMLLSIPGQYAFTLSTVPSPYSGTDSMKLMLTDGYGWYNLKLEYDMY